MVGYSGFGNENLEFPFFTLSPWFHSCKIAISNFFSVESGPHPIENSWLAILVEISALKILCDRTRVSFESLPKSWNLTVKMWRLADLVFDSIRL